MVAVVVAVGALLAAPVGACLAFTPVNVGQASSSPWGAVPVDLDRNGLVDVVTCEESGKIMCVALRGGVGGGRGGEGGKAGWWMRALLTAFF
jgi:hypothetical protein